MNPAKVKAWLSGPRGGRYYLTASGEKKYGQEAVDAARADAAASPEKKRELKSLGAPIDPPMGLKNIDWFKQMRKDSNNDKKRLMELAASGAKTFYFHSNTGPIIVHPSAQSPGKWQMTYFGKDGTPYGHAERKTLAQALDEAKQMGAKIHVPQPPADPLARMAQAKATKGYDPRELLTKALTDGGLTYDLAHDIFPTKGFSVSTHPDRETIIPGKTSINAEHLESFIQINKDLLDKDPHARVGVWYNDKEDKWYIDVSHVETDRAVAYKLGFEHNQKGIFDLEKGETVDVTGPEEPLAKPPPKT